MGWGRRVWVSRGLPRGGTFNLIESNQDGPDAVPCLRPLLRKKKNSNERADEMGSGIEIFLENEGLAKTPMTEQRKQVLEQGRTQK